MTETFAAHGVRFQYPPEWEVSEQQNGDELSITVSSPQTSFWTLTLFHDCPDPETIMEAVLAAFREEYAELDIYESHVRVCDLPTVAFDIEFVCLELLNSAWARVFSMDECTALILYQAYDEELAETGELLELITRSLEFDAELADDGESE